MSNPGNDASRVMSGRSQIEQAARAPLSVRRFYQQTTTLAPANPLDVAPRWFWMNDVGKHQPATSIAHPGVWGAPSRRARVAA